MKVRAYGVKSFLSSVEEMEIVRKKPQGHDVLIKIKYCGVCHSDLHHIRNNWKDSTYPMVPGHEIIGTVEAIGAKVKEFTIGDKVAVGNMLDSCQECSACNKYQEQYCSNDGPTWTYNSREREIHGQRTLEPLGTATYGGYSTHIVCKSYFVFKLPTGMFKAGAAPLLCAGITMYNPLSKIPAGKTVGIAGIGGLGHLGIMIGASLGLNIIGLTTSESKVEDIQRFGAKDVIMMSSSEDRTRYEGKVDVIVNTLPSTHDIFPYLQLLKRGEGILHVVGNLNDYPGDIGRGLIFEGKQFTTSNVGGSELTREFLKFCHTNNILAEVEEIEPDQITEALSDVKDKLARYRYVIKL